MNCGDFTLAWERDPDAWRGTEHASSEWEHLEPLAGPEYRMWRNLHQREQDTPMPRTMQLGKGTLRFWRQ